MKRAYTWGLNWKHTVTSVFKIISPSRPLKRRWRAQALATYWKSYSPSTPGVWVLESQVPLEKIIPVSVWNDSGETPRPTPGRPGGWQTTEILCSQSAPAYAFQKQQFLVDRENLDSLEEVSLTLDYVSKKIYIHIRKDQIKSNCDIFCKNSTEDIIHHVLLGLRPALCKA